VSTTRYDIHADIRIVLFRAANRIADAADRGLG
jgi:hypothetical protein